MSVICVIDLEWREKCISFTIIFLYFMIVFETEKICQSPILKFVLIENLIF